MRAPNEIDFWRGFALLTIFVNHVPGIAFERFTSRNFMLADSAEMFVFLAGCSLRFVVGSDDRRASMHDITFRLLGRALQIYAAQILITMFALAILGAAGYFLAQPALLDWHNAGPVFHEPVETHIGLVLLPHQLGYFNLLPLYVVLMMAAPIFAFLDRISPWLLLAVSVAVWMSVLVTGYNLPTWHTRLKLGIDNAFDKQPPILYQNNSLNGNIDERTHDPVGRYYWVDVNVRF